MANVSFGQLVDPAEQDIQRRYALAQALQQQSSSPIQQQTAGGRAVKISPFEGLAKIAQALAAGKMNTDAMGEQKALLDQKRNQSAADIEGIVKALRGTPAQSYETGANEMGDDAATQNIAAQKPDLAKAYAAAIRSEDPRAQAIGGALLPSMLPKAAKMERVEVPDGKGGKRVGFVNINAENPMSTFQEGGVDPVKNIAVNGQLVNPVNAAPTGAAIPKQADAPNLGRDLVIPGKGGAMVPNAPLLDARKQIAKSGASNVSLTANTATKPFLTEIGKGVGEQVVNDFSGARSAQQVLNNVTQIESGLKNVIAGPAAGVRIKLSQIGEVLGVNGADATEQLQNTRQVMQGLARQEMAAAAGMKGQGQITESERAILRKAESGSIDEITVPEMRTLLGALRKTSQFRIGVHNENLSRLKKDPNAAGVVDYMQLPSGGGGGASVLDQADAILRGGK